MMRKSPLLLICACFFSVLLTDISSYTVLTSEASPSIYIWYDNNGKKHATTTPPPKGAKGVKSFSLESFKRGEIPFPLLNDEDERGADAREPEPFNQNDGPVPDKSDLNNDPKEKKGILKVNVKGDKVYVPVIIYSGESYVGDSGVRLTLLMDTGASTTVIYKDAAEKAGIIPSGEATAHLADGSPVQAETAVLQRLDVGTFIHKDARVFIIDSARENENFSGLLGMDFLKRMKFVMDFDNEVLRFPTN